jgi:hypothetical protein
LGRLADHRSREHVEVAIVVCVHETGSPCYKVSDTFGGGDVTTYRVITARPERRERAHRAGVLVAAPFAVMAVLFLALAWLAADAPRVWPAYAGAALSAAIAGAAYALARGVGWVCDT